MPRLQPVDPATATGKTKEVLDTINTKMGRVPNIFAIMANSPAAVQGYLNFGAALADGVLSAKARESIAIACAETNMCEYCLSAHTFIGKSIGMTDKELIKAQEITSEDPKTDAAVKFARLLLLRKADISNEEMAPLREAGLTDAEITEVVANVALNVFTNYFNHVAETEVDFPKAKLAFPA